MDDRHNCTAGDRFDRLESGISKISELIEQIAHLLSETTHNRQDIEDHEKRIRLLERIVAKNEVIAKWVERIIWTIIAGAIYFYRDFAAVIGG